jgi:hypothetical protein
VLMSMAIASWLRALSSQHLEKRDDVLPGFAFNGMRDATGLQVHKDARLGMTLTDTELIDPNILEILQGGCFILALQMLLMDILYQIPTDPQDSGYPQHGVNPVHFGQILIVTTAIGALSPPFGVDMFIACSITKVSIEKYARGGKWILLSNLGSLLLITFIPQIAILIPSFLRMKLGI